MNYVPLAIFLVVVLGLVAFAGRARRRQAAATRAMAENIAVGSEVMTTSGLHGTVVARHDDGTVALSIAPGVEVRWEFAALRDLASLPSRIRSAHATALDTGDPAEGAEGEELHRTDLHRTDLHRTDLQKDAPNSPTDPT